MNAVTCYDFIDENENHLLSRHWNISYTLVGTRSLVDRPDRVLAIALNLPTLIPSSANCRTPAACDKKSAPLDRNRRRKLLWQSSQMRRLAFRFSVCSCTRFKKESRLILMCLYSRRVFAAFVRPDCLNIF